MDSTHYALWQRCRAFVGRVCATRDASHGLGHMEKVTEGAVLLYLMSRSAKSPVDAASLSRVILVGMLHDVADHKYDHDGQLEAVLRDFVATEVTQWGPDAQTEESTAAHVLAALEAVSYSKENKRGMRWFEASLPAEWIAARDYVSDADKLDAIGADGLMRCYEYTCHVHREKCGAAADAATPAFASLAALEGVLLKNVVDHHAEKLCRLSDEFIVTPEGKFLAAPQQEAMSALLAVWQAQGPPPVTLYWPDAASYCGCPA